MSSVSGLAVASRPAGPPADALAGCFQAVAVCGGRLRRRAAEPPELDKTRRRARRGAARARLGRGSQRRRPHRAGAGDGRRDRGRADAARPRLAAGQARRPRRLRRRARDLRARAPAEPPRAGAGLPRAQARPRAPALDRRGDDGAGGGRGRACLGGAAARGTAGPHRPRRSRARATAEDTRIFDGCGATWRAPAAGGGVKRRVVLS